MKSTSDTAAEAERLEPAATPFLREQWSLGGARFFEFHDQSWFPETLRDGVTDLLQAVLSLGQVYRPIASILNEAIKATDAEQVVDLCSGGSGPWLWLHKLLRKTGGSPITIFLTDKFPNISAFENVRQSSNEVVSFYPRSVDAARLPPDLSGFRTIFTSFHHFTPEQAVAILQNAVDAGQGIGIFEAASRRPLTILSTILMPLGSLVTTPFVKPFKISRLLWTYVIPVIPFVLYFDGIVSCLRAYSQNELRNLVAHVSSKGYVWRIGEQCGGLTPITFLVGYPKEASERHTRDAGNPSPVRFRS